MFACLKYGYSCFGNAYGFMLTFLLCCYALGCHALLVVSIPFIFPCLIVVHLDVGDGLRCMTVVCPKYRRYACPFTSSWLNACIMALLICSCMMFIVDASGHVML